MAITRLSNNDLLTPSKGQSVRNGDVQPVRFNAATGGTTTDVSNYNGTGQTWRVHSFLSSGTFTVTQSTQPFSVLVVGAGGAGASNGGNSGPAGGSGGGGNVAQSSSLFIPPAANAVTVGVSGNPALGSSIGTLVTALNGPNGTTSSGVPAGPSNLTTSTITGSSVSYAGQGSPGGWCSPNCSGGGGDMPNNRGAGQAGERGGQGNCCYGPSRPGNDGIVVIAYRIA